MIRFRRGFTLIEVLVALAIFAIGIMASLRALGVAAGGLDDQRVRLMAGWVAQNRLADLRVTGRFPDTGLSDGEVDMGGRTFFWREDVKSTPNPLFKRVDVTVYANRDDEHALTTLSGFAVRPLR